MQTLLGTIQPENLTIDRALHIARRHHVTAIAACPVRSFLQNPPNRPNPHRQFLRIPRHTGTVLNDALYRGSIECR